MINCLFCGVGGQGIILTSRVLAQAAMNRGLFARTAETIGMAQRGGSVVSHVRYGGTIHSPLIPLGGADVIVGFEPGEAVRSLPYLKKGGLVITAMGAIQPTTTTAYEAKTMLDFLKSHTHFIPIDGAAITEICGSPKVLNMALLGAAAAQGALGITLQEIETTLREKLHERLIPMNLRALALGKEAISNG